MNLKTTISLLALTAIIGQGYTAQPLLANAQDNIDNALEVASVIQRPAAEDVVESSILSIPSSPANTESPVDPDFYTLDVADGTQTVVQVVSTDDFSSLYVNAREVIRFRSEAGGVFPQERARIAAEKLYKALSAGELALADIKPALVNKLFVIKFGEEVLATVDWKTAKAAKLNAARLAYLWANQVREALGETVLDEQAYKKLASLNDPSGNYRNTGRVQSGKASWYGPGFHGRRAADGSRFNQNAMTAAHKTLPFGTLVRVKNNRTQKACVVRITDRGPYAHGRIIDLSKGAAQAIGMLGSGVANVTIEVVKPNS